MNFGKGIVPCIRPYQIAVCLLSLQFGQSQRILQVHGVSSLKLAMKIWVKYLISAIFSPRGSWMSMHGGSPFASRSVLQTKLERANCDLK